MQGEGPGEGQARCGPEPTSAVLPGHAAPWPEGLGAMVCLTGDGGNSGGMSTLSSDRALPGRGWTSAPCTVWEDLGMCHSPPLGGTGHPCLAEYWEDKLLRDRAHITLHLAENAQNWHTGEFKEGKSLLHDPGVGGLES